MRYEVYFIIVILYEKINNNVLIFFIKRMKLYMQQVLTGHRQDLFSSYNSVVDYVLSSYTPGALDENPLNGIILATFVMLLQLWLHYLLL